MIASMNRTIDEATYLPIGGVKQWVVIRGTDVGNPPLVVVHGGPGMSDTSFLRACNADLETSFTVVYWDQRGTGRSFDPAIPRESMTLSQFLRDLDELVGLVCARLGHEKVVLLGHSWGSLLGVMYAARAPDKVAAYVGAAQIGDWRAAEAASYRFAIAEAKRLGRTRALKELTQIGPPPYSGRAVMKERRCVQSLEGQFRPGSLRRMWSVTLGAPGVSLRDLPKLVRGFRFSVDTMWAEVSQLNLLELVPELAVPAFFLLGRRDHWVPPETSVAYVDTLVAPSKQVVWFEESGHEPFVDEPEKFNAVMVELVRPVCATSRAEANKARVRQIFGAVNRHDVDAIVEQYAPDYVLHGAPPGISPDRAGLRKQFEALFTAFPDANATIEDLVAERDEVVCRVTFRGTQRGPLLGIPPTGNVVAVNEVYISRFAGDKCLEEWRVMDELGLMQQLGTESHLAARRSPN